MQIFIFIDNKSTHPIYNEKIFLSPSVTQQKLISYIVQSMKNISPFDKLCNSLSDSPLFHTNPTKRIPIVLKRNIVFLQIPLAKIRKCLRRPNDPKVFPRRKAEFLHPRYTKRRTRLRASLSKTNANYTLTKLRVQFVSRPGGVASNFGRNGSSST